MRTGSAATLLLLVAGVLLGPTPAAPHHLAGPCDSHRFDGGSDQTFSRRRIICAVERFGPVPGGSLQPPGAAGHETGA